MLKWPNGIEGFLWMNRNSHDIDNDSSNQMTMKLHVLKTSFYHLSWLNCISIERKNANQTCIMKLLKVKKECLNNHLTYNLKAWLIVKFECYKGIVKL